MLRLRLWGHSIKEIIEVITLEKDQVFILLNLVTGTHVLEGIHTEVLIHMVPTLHTTDILAAIQDMEGMDLITDLDMAMVTLVIHME